MRQLVFLLPLFLLAHKLSAQQASQPQRINWVSIEEAERLNQKEPRKIMIDLYTDWCGWCKRMDASTFTHPTIVEYVNEKYYAVKLNAETRDTINFMGHTFVNPNPNAPRGTNQIATIGAQEGGRLGYPTLVYLDEQLNRLSVVPGYQTAQGIEPIITYFGENHYKETPWNEYQQKFKGTISE